MPRLSQIPFLVALVALSGVAMVVPVLHGYATGDANSGRPFFYGAITVLFLATLLGLATYAREEGALRRDALVSVILAYVLLPPILALPFHQALPDTSFANAWFEMLSSFTTTGATLYDTPGRLAPTLHLWRALVGWLGGFYILVVAVAVLLPMNLGGMEVLTGRAARAITSHCAAHRYSIGRAAQEHATEPDVPTCPPGGAHGHEEEDHAQQIHRHRDDRRACRGKREGHRQHHRQHHRCNG